MQAQGNYVNQKAERDLIRDRRAEPAEPAMRSNTATTHDSEVLLEAVTVCITQILNAIEGGDAYAGTNHSLLGN